jgi:ParB-like chromosome segregation protein Spo0J
MNVNYHLNLSPSSLEIIYRSVDGLRPDPANPRCHSKKQVRQIAESIKAFGFNVPILIDRDGNVVAGTGRLAACGELGMTQVPTLCLDHLRLNCWLSASPTTG